jgi:hypothetical protein
MKHSLADFKGRYHSMPSTIMDLLTGDAFLIFSRIYAHSKKTICEDEIQISAKTLSKLTRRSERKVAQSIKELEDIGFIFVKGSERGKRTYIINWDEIYKLNQFTSGISYEGIAKLNEICHSDNGITPFSQIPKNILDEISADFKYDSKSAANPALNTENAADLETSDNQSADISALNTKMSADGQTRIVQSVANPALKDEIAADENKTADISALNAEFAAVSPVTMQKLQQIYGLDTAIAADSSHIILEQGGEIHLYVKLSGAEQIIARKIGINSVKLVFSSAANPALNTEMSADEKKSAAISALKDKNLLTFGTSVNIYNKYNNKNIYKGEEIKQDLYLSLDNDPKESSQLPSKNDWVRAWFDSRDFSLPVLSSSDFEQIISQPKFRDGDEDEIIRYVWDSINFSEMEEMDDYRFPAIELKRIIEHAWTERKEIKGGDMTLSEQDAKNIFGFDLEEQAGELFCIIASSKLRDISCTTKENPVHTRIRNEQDRKSRISFIDSIQEVADIDIEKLSAAEYATLLMVDYVKERAENGQARPDEITKTQYRELLKDWAQTANVPESDLKLLWKEIPQKGRVRLSYMQLLPDKIFKYNHEHDDCMDVEELYNKKMAEEG